MSEEKQPNNHFPPLVMHLARYLPMLILGGLAVNLLLPQLGNLRYSLQVLRSMLWWAVGLAIIAQIMSYISGGILLQIIIRTTGKRIPLGPATLIPMAAGSIGLVVGGIVGVITTTYRWLRRYQVDGNGALLAGWLPIQLENGMVIGFAIISLAHLLSTGTLTLLQIIGFSLVLLALLLTVAAVIWSLTHREQTIGLAQKVTGRWARLLRRPHNGEGTRKNVQQFLDTWDMMRAGGWRGPVLATAFNLGFDIVTLYFIFLGARFPVRFDVLLTGYGLPLLLGKVSFLPGGVGIVEATMAAIYTGLGVPSAVTVIVILIYRFLTFWFPTILGFLLVPYLNRLNGENHRTSA